MNVIIVAFFIILAIILVGYVDFLRFLFHRKKVAHSFSEASTKFGLIQYLDIGPKDAPAILFSTGGGAGIDSVYMLDWLVRSGYRLIAVNRPGYYNLPANAVSSIRGHADIYKAVIDFLDIKEVNVFGVSIGALSSLYYAQSYSVKSMVLWSPVTGQYRPKKEALDTAFAKLFLSPKMQDFISWLLRRTMDFFPRIILVNLVHAEAEMEKKAIKTVVASILNDPQEKKRAIQFIHSLAPMSKIYPGMMDELKKSAKEQTIDWNKIDLPVLTYASTIDKDVTQDHFSRLTENLINGECRLVKGGGHFVWWGPEGKEVQSETLKFFNQANQRTK